MSLNRQRGLTIIEIMVALTLSLLLLAGVIQIFQANKTTYRVTEANSRVQESGRFAVELIGRDLRAAGLQGCANIDSVSVNVIADPPAPVFNTDNALIGYEYTGGNWTPALPGGVAAVPGTDAIRVQSAGGTGIGLQGNLTARNANVQLNPTNLFSANEVLFITDCENGDIFRATNVGQGATQTAIAHSNAGNTTNFLSKLYSTKAEVMAFRQFTYFIMDTGRDTPQGQDILALARIGLGGAAEELIEGIADMQIEYGEDLNNDGAADRFVPANQLLGGTGNTRDVVAVRVHLLTESGEDGITSQPQQYTLNGVNVVPADQRLRRVFSSTVQLRNAGLY